MRDRTRVVRGAFALAVLLVVGCAGAPPLMPSPNLVVQQGYPLTAVDEARRGRMLELLYVTDRQSDNGSNERRSYGAERSASMAFGVARVALGDPDLTWEQIVAASEATTRDNKITYAIDAREERGRFPDSPYPFVRTPQGPAVDPVFAADYDEQARAFKHMVREKLAQSSKKDVVMFVHGFNNTLDDATFTMAGLWHFLDREAVPLVYSWPAAHGGIKGYFIDRESGEYTIFHLKETLRLLVSMPEVRNIHLIAHSRGTDVTTSALRELLIEQRGKGGSVRDAFRIANLILAAPDLDFGVIQQRLMAERFGLAFGQITIYTSQSDKALGFAQFLMSGLRFGRVKSSDVGENEQAIFSEVGNVSIVDVARARSFVGHAYFHENPGVSSDIVRLIHDQAPPGSPMRPMEHLGGNFWRINPGYPQDVDK